MSNPLICNSAPAAGAVAGVSAASRCSVLSSTKILLGSTNAYLGSGPAFYAGVILPEEYVNTAFAFSALSGTPNKPATRSMVGDALKIEKVLDPPENQEAVYFFGGLQAPALPDAPLMAEFKLRLDPLDVTPNNNFSGVLFGLLANNSGLTIRFFTDGANQWIEMFDAVYGTVHRPGWPGTTYRADYDWSVTEHVYKLLWHPGLNRVRLYVSTGFTSPSPDLLLIDGLVSDFPDIPVDERRLDQPWAFFGHGYAAPKSISYWSGAYLHNMADAAVEAGRMCGRHTGYLRPMVVTTYLPASVPNNDDQPWLPLPESFGSIGGAEYLQPGCLHLANKHPYLSAGYYRIDPMLESSVAIFDFKLGISHEPISAGITSGAEVFLTDGTKMCRVCFLYSAGTYYVGILRDATQPQLLTAYLTSTMSWLSERAYRLIYDPAGNVTLCEVGTGDDGRQEYPIMTLPVSLLPDLPAPGAGVPPSPAVGLLINGAHASSVVDLAIARLRYSTSNRSQGSALPVSPWTYNGPAPESSYAASADGILNFNGSQTSAPVWYFRTDTFDHEDAVVAEFCCRVTAYAVSGVPDAPRACTGAGVVLDDGTYKTSLVFADEGPELGKIVFLATNNDWEINLLSIRKGELENEPTYARADWSVFHIYRIERIPNGRLRLYIDDFDKPVLDFDANAFAHPPTSSAGTSFGGLMIDRATVCDWRWLRYSTSVGYVLKVFPLLSENEILHRFDHAANLIVETDEA